jgi:ABC-type glutathione transport system ATPase component
MEPELLLFDEPTSALDPELVGEVLRVIRTLADEGRTMLLVTHELGFAYHVANRVIFLADGVIHEQGTPEQVLKNPQQDRTRAFLASHNAIQLLVPAMKVASVVLSEAPKARSRRTSFASTHCAPEKRPFDCAALRAASLRATGLYCRT